MAKKKKIEIHSIEREADNYMEVFKAQPEQTIEMSEFLKEMEEESKWYNLYIKNFKTSVESGGPIILDDIKSRYKFLDGTTDEAITSAIENGTQIGTLAGSQMFVTTTDIDSTLRTICLSGTGLSSLILRSGVDCSAIGKANVTDTKTMIDIGIKNSGDKTVLAYFSCGKIRTFNGGNTYAILKQSKMFDAIVEMLNTKYKKYEFNGGYYSHTRTFAEFELTDDTDKILKTYKKACESVSSMKNKGLKVAFSFSTSEIGDACATINVALIRGNMRILIGSPIKVPHNGEMTEENFINQLPLLLAKTKDLIKGLENLINIEVKNPINCIISLAKYVGLLKSQTMSEVASFQEQYNKAIEKDKNVKFSAHDVFYVLQESLMEMRKASVADSTIENAEENLARTLVEEFDWGNFDVPIRPEWNQK